ncbi:MAG: hypothetical protein A3H98_07630 [Bacteroidetes bacterium RIFCSPLOWO2_02_FULL_36_8]|nr:MAG: hypothetical protein A3H98_07630 [Bacteroidetes bacterium RIFCSPLOWO2_02_FULL_36_8]OFY71976.1 MAG: hypothetical protein A3G23_00075 [Bacteroidetes bacterium RIFCSPLOWO2_12_FULL_37_12]
MKIIGITGTNGAGKGTLVEFLIKQKGYNHFSVREFLIEEIKKKGLPVNRDSMVIVANELRTKHSPSYIVERLFERAEKLKNNCIIESLRAVGEVEALKKKEGFLFLAVDADPEIRFKRIRLRDSETDKIDFTTFLSNEQREMNSEDPFKQNLSKCIAMADHVFMNSGTIDEFYKELEGYFGNIEN